MYLVRIPLHWSHSTLQARATLVKTSSKAASKVGLELTPVGGISSVESTAWIEQPSLNFDLCLLVSLQNLVFGPLKNTPQELDCRELTALVIRFPATQHVPDDGCQLPHHGDASNATSSPAFDTLEPLP